MYSYIWEAFAKPDHNRLIRAMGRFSDKRHIEKYGEEIEQRALQCALDRFSDFDPQVVVINRIFMEEQEAWQKEYE